MNKQDFSIAGDLIEQLPSDQTIPSHNEIRMVDSIFNEKISLMDKVLRQTKDILILGIFFIIFSLPQVDELIKKCITISDKSPYILILIKSCFFMLSYFIIQNLYLVRK
jgi:hypothetical protein